LVGLLRARQEYCRNPVVSQPLQVFANVLLLLLTRYATARRATATTTTRVQQFNISLLGKQRHLQIKILGANFLNRRGQRGFAVHGKTRQKLGPLPQVRHHGGRSPRRVEREGDRRVGRRRRQLVVFNRVDEQRNVKGAQHAAQFQRGGFVEGTEDRAGELLGWCLCIVVIDGTVVVVGTVNPLPQRRHRSIPIGETVGKDGLGKGNAAVVVLIIF